MKYYLSAACIIKNEASYIEEWLEYHLLVGVQHFYIYDNDSTDNIKEILEPYVSDGIVDYVSFPGIGMQNPMIKDVINKSKDETRWLAILDIDEFIVPESTDTIPEFLKKYEDKPSVVMQWIVFGDNHQKNRDKGLVIERFTSHAPKTELSQVKSIINPRLADGDSCHIHFGKFNTDVLSVNTDGKDIIRDDDKSYIPVGRTSANIHVNHYVVKSAEEFRDKSQKGAADGKWNQARFNNEKTFWDNYHKDFNRNEIKDDMMMKYYEPVKNAIAERRKVK